VGPALDLLLHCLSPDAPLSVLYGRDDNTERVLAFFQHHKIDLSGDSDYAMSAVWFWANFVWLWALLASSPDDNADTLLEKTESAALAWLCLLFDRNYSAFLAIVRDMSEMLALDLAQDDSVSLRLNHLHGVAFPQKQPVCF
jgi:hypothetical protein